AAAKSGENGAGQEKSKEGDRKPATQKDAQQGADRAGQPKGQPKDADRTKSEDDSEKTTGERRGQTPSSTKPGGSGASGKTGGSKPTAPTPHPNDATDDRPNPEQDPPESPTRPNAAHQNRAGELQLEDIK